MIYVYDNSFEGFLTAIFECYRLKHTPTQIVKRSEYIPGMYDRIERIKTDTNKADRVIKGLADKLSKKALLHLLKAWHTELPTSEFNIYHYVKLALTTKINIEQDFRQPAVLFISKANKKMDREIHRMHAFVRFHKTKDDIYAATIQPDFDVMPFIGNHFEQRYVDQKWLIYDTKRGYGLFYDLKSTERIVLKNPQWSGKLKIPESSWSTDERSFQEMWQAYFKSTSIPARKNVQLHIQHVPRRYWHYLPEKYLH